MLVVDFATALATARRLDLTAVLRQMFTRDDVHAPPRPHYSLGRANTLLLMPAWRPGCTGVKVATVFPANPTHGLQTVQGAYLLFGGETGTPRAVIDGAALTLVRTAALSALGADLLAPRDAKSFLLLGTGALAAPLAIAHVSQRTYEEVSVWGRSKEKASIVVSTLRREGINAVLVEDRLAKLRTADVICAATNATSPIVEGSCLGAQAHVNLVGSWLPEMREADDEVIRRATRIVVDNEEAKHASADLAAPLANGVIDASDIVPLATAISDAQPSTGITVFKSVGTAKADLAVAEALVSAVQD